MRCIFTAILLVLFTQSVYSQDIKRPETYNYLRGMEAMEKDNDDEALVFFNKDIAENPKNGYSYSWVAMLRLTHEEYGKALTASNLAIKYLPEEDKEYVGAAHVLRGQVYLELGDTSKALADLTAAIKILPDEPRGYKERARLYYELKQYDLSDADFKKMTELNPGDVYGYMGIGRNANDQKRWSDAIRQFDYVEKLDDTYSPVYSFRAESYIGLEKWGEATDDLIRSLSIDWDKLALSLLPTLKEPALSMFIAKLKVQAAQSPSDYKWPYILGGMYSQKGDEGKALEYFMASNDIVESPFTLYRISRGQDELGDYVSALKSIDRALELDSTSSENMMHKANVLYNSGNIDGSIKMWDSILAQYPDFAWGYYERGWYKGLSGNLEEAVEDLSMSIILEPDYPYAYCSRGDFLKKLGKNDLAEADFRKVIELEQNPELYTCIFYAYAGIGQYDKAKETMEAYISQDPDEASNYYEAACLYSRMKDKATALKYLEEAFKRGYNKFNHIDLDYDMDFLRTSKEFKNLLSKYRGNTSSKDAITSVASGRKAVVTEIPFTKESGVTKVKCKINGLPLHFVFDTGASDVTISMVEATFMMKNGYLDKKDITGSQRYIDANGDISVGTVINLKSVQFGGLSLENVRASVVRN